MVPSLLISSVSDCYKGVLCCAFAFTFLASCGGGGNNEGAVDAGAKAPESGALTSPYDVYAPSDAGATTPAAHADASPAADPSPAANRDVIVEASSGKTCGIANFQQEVMTQVNAARASSRYCNQVFYPAAQPLSWNLKLFNAAAGHSAEMANNNYFSHTGLDGRTSAERATGAGYTWRTVAENISGGRSTIQATIEGWLKSPGHCANIMNGQFVDIAVSCVANPSSEFKKYWTMVLAAPR